MNEDIVDELEAEGSDLSRRAARYIRIKRATCGLLEEERRATAEKSLQELTTVDQEPRG
jgi:hypothetical protein